MGSNAAILRDVLDTSEIDVPAKEIPKDISSKEERKIHRRNLNSTKTLKHIKKTFGTKDKIIKDQLYSPDQFDSLNCPTELPGGGLFSEGGADDGILVLAESSEVDKKSSELLCNMYTRFAACVYSLNFPSPRDARGALVIDQLDEKIRLLTGDDITSKGWESEEDYGEEDLNEQRQLRRLTSWNTQGTYGTYASGDYTSGQAASARARSTSPRPAAATKSSSLRKGSYGGSSKVRRKRVVKFDYPVVKSLKECPRPDPKDLPNLYFTEEELGQIEDDRESTYTADDVEVVCVSTSTSTESSEDSIPPSPASQASVLPGKDSSLLAPTPRTTSNKSRLQKAHSPAKNLAVQPRSASTRKPVDSSRKRQIKSVQIYLRERSRDRGQKS